jgi:hypothetical protein
VLSATVEYAPHITAQKTDFRKAIFGWRSIHMFQSSCLVEILSQTFQSRFVDKSASSLLCVQRDDQQQTVFILGK